MKTLLSTAFLDNAAEKINVLSPRGLLIVLPGVTVKPKTLRKVAHKTVRAKRRRRAFEQAIAEWLQTRRFELNVPQ